MTWDLGISQERRLSASYPVCEDSATPHAKSSKSKYPLAPKSSKIFLANEGCDAM